MHDNANEQNVLNLGDAAIDAKSTEHSSTEGFIMPNSDWPTREINGVTYIFGEGNPKEVALNPSDYTGDGQWQNYMTPESEAYLKDFLENKSLKDFVDKCGEPLGLTNNNTMSGFNITKSEDLDINKLLLVDANTGRKQFDEEKVYGISQLLYGVTSELEGESAITFCMNAREMKAFNELYDNYNKMTESYVNQPTDAYYNRNMPGYDLIQKARRMMSVANSK